MPATKVKVDYADVVDLLSQRGFKKLEGKNQGWFEAKLYQFADKDMFTPDFPVTDDKGDPNERLKSVLIDILAGLEEDSEFELTGFPEEQEEQPEAKKNGKKGKGKRKPKKEESSEEKESESDAEQEQEKESEKEEEEPVVLTEKEMQEIRDRYKMEPGADPMFEWYPEFSVEKADELLEANFRNRPRRKAITQRYAEMYLTKTWGRTLEPIIFDWNGEMGSGQHRCYGLKLAEEIRQSDPEQYKAKYGWEGPITAPMVVAFGADPEAVDYLDRGQQRTGGDVLFRRSEFDEDQYTENDLKRLSGDLAKAAKLCWIKTGEKEVSDAPHFPHSEMIEFIEAHPNLKDMVEYVYQCDSGRDRKISKWINRGAMAGLAYLFAASKTETDENGLYEEVDFSMLDKAKQFVADLASGTTENENAPIHQFREWVTRQMTKMGATKRGPRVEIKLYMLTKVWHAYLADEEMSNKSFRVPQSLDLKIGGIA